MQEGTPLQARQINRELLVSILNSPKWFFGAVSICAIGVLIAMATAGFMINQGFGVTGLNRPVMWGFFITNFVFWIGISHAGVMLSAILRLSKAETCHQSGRDSDSVLADDGNDYASDSHGPPMAYCVLDLHIAICAL